MAPDRPPGLPQDRSPVLAREDFNHPYSRRILELTGSPLTSCCATISTAGTSDLRAPHGTVPPRAGGAAAIRSLAAQRPLRLSARPPRWRPVRHVRPQHSAGDQPRCDARQLATKAADTGSRAPVRLGGKPLDTDRAKRSLLVPGWRSEAFRRVDLATFAACKRLRGGRLAFGPTDTSPSSSPIRAWRTHSRTSRRCAPLW